jgi:dienelactone hydrolase
MFASKVMKIAISLCALVSLTLWAITARADLAQKRGEEMLAALQAGKFDKAEVHFDGVMRAALPPAKLGAVWTQFTDQNGSLQSFKLAEQREIGGHQIRIFNLEFERGSTLAAQISINSLSHEISGLYFSQPPPKPLSATESKRADNRVSEMLEKLRDADFEAAETHFDSAMSQALPPADLAIQWHQRTDSLGALKSWRIASRFDAGGGILVRIVNLEFEKASKPFALKIAVDPSGEIGGLFFVAPAPEPTSSAAGYVDPGSFRARVVRVGVDSALEGTVLIPLGVGPFRAAVLVQGAGTNDRDETIGPNRPFKDLAEGLASSGIAVLRYDKRTYGANKATIDQARVTVESEVIADAATAVRLLKAQPEIDRGRVYVVGHSLGAMLAPAICKRSSAAGVAMLAPGGRRVAQIYVDQARYLNGSDPEVIDSVKTARLVASHALPPDQLFAGAPASFWYDLDARDEFAIARCLCKPILILRGERDYVVTSQDIDIWRRKLKNVRYVEIETMPSFNHLLMPGTGQPAPDEYFVANHVDPAVIVRLAKFING